MSISDVLVGRLDKERWRRDLNMRGHKGNNVTPELAEALRNEIRKALDAEGGPFDQNVARRVYDLAIAARDMCVASSSSVDETISTITHLNGPVESMDSPETPESVAQNAETFGARIIREVLAAIPKITASTAPAAIHTTENPEELVHALAEARKYEMHDVAEGLEVRLFGRVLSAPRRPEVALRDFNHTGRATKHFDQLLGFCICDACSELPMCEPRELADEGEATT